MLGRIGNQVCQSEMRPSSLHEDRYARNEKEDLKTGIDYLYEFREKLNKLHPFVIDLIDQMLQRPRY
jgi:hypothetical protein